MGVWSDQVGEGDEGPGVRPVGRITVYDATQHLFNCRARLRSDPDGTIRRFADLLEVDHERVRLWTFARAAAEPREDWKDDSMALARVPAS